MRYATSTLLLRAIVFGVLLASGSPAPAICAQPVAPPPEGSAPAETATPDTLHNHAPAFPGGDAALLRFIQERLRYPALAARNRVQGRVVVLFWLDERGHPYGFLKGLGAGLDDEAIRILREMPDWSPAILGGRPALMQLRIPVTFRLAD